MVPFLILLHLDITDGEECPIRPVQETKFLTCLYLLRNLTFDTYGRQDTIFHLNQLFRLQTSNVLGQLGPIESRNLMT